MSSNGRTTGPETVRPAPGDVGGYVRYEVSMEDGRTIVFYASWDEDHGAIRQILSRSRDVREYEEEVDG